MKVAYPHAHLIERLDTPLLALKIARHSPCTKCSDCPGIHPPRGVDVVPDGHSDSSLGDLGQYGSDDDDEVASSYLERCACGHIVEDHNADDKILGRSEFDRRARVAVRLDELLQDSGRLLDFDYTDEDILSLRKQMSRPRSGVSLANHTNVSPEQPGIPSLPPHSPSSSSGVSELHAKPPRKKRPASLSSLSDAEEADDDDDEEDGPPLAAGLGLALSRQSRGKRPGGNQGKRPKPGPSDSSSEPLQSTPINGRRRALKGHDPLISKPEDVKMNDEQMNGLTVGVPLDPTGRSSSAAPTARSEKKSAIELRNGLITITAVDNNKEPRNLIILTGLKTLFQKQLPKMPREYIARLVYDCNSKALAIIKWGLKVVGGICYRPFPQRGFAEIVFFATNSADQEKGYGGMLMDHFKAHIRKAYPTMMHFLTYADNYAVGYFEKQGFSKEISLDRSQWAGYIKDYEGGTIMQCTMLPKIDYLDKKHIFKVQQEAIMQKIREMSKSHVVYLGLPQFQPGAPPGVKVDPKDVPGLRETGWSPEMATLLSRSPVKNSVKNMMEQILKELKDEPKAWAFLKPVSRDDALDYYDIVKNPMDFETIDQKIESNQYKTFDSFVDDVQLVFDNCRLYNPESNIYARNARHMDTFFKALVERHLQEKK